MNRLICNDTGTSKRNTDISGLFPYDVADYGASWATTATITASLGALFAVPQNGDACVLHNTNGTGGGARLYLYTNSTWSYK
jgi:hypothetical protein